MFPPMVYGQNYSPKVVILDPHEKHVDEIYEREIRKYEIKQITTVEYDQEILNQIKSQTEQENEIIMEYKEYIFRKEMNYFSRITLGFSGFLTYKFYNYNSNCLVFPVHRITNENIEEYKILTDEFDVDWLINPLSVKTYIKDEQVYTDLRIQLYSKRKNKILLDKTYTGSSKNPGFEWSCKDGSINCTVNNAQAQAIEDILKNIDK